MTENNLMFIIIATAMNLVERVCALRCCALTALNCL